MTYLGFSENPYLTIMKNYLLFLIVLVGFSSCLSEIKRLGNHYKAHQDYASLAKVVDLVPLGTDTAYIRSILGDPIDMGFDFRYTVDSVGPNDCVIGAVFHIDEKGKIDQKWIDEICE